ncbi:MAG: biotin/lipoyl-containing protein, partial [Chloroflexota bacterium]
MAIEIYMPQLGLTMTEGTVVRWLKKPGEMVRKGEVLFEVETDKVVQEVTSLDEGVLLKLLVEEGKTVPVGSVIGYLGKAGEAVGDGETRGRGDAERELGVQHSAPSTQHPEQDSGLRTQDSQTPSKPGWVKASPAAKLLAKKLGVELSSLKGTGPGGRIVEADVRAAVEAVAAKPVAEAPRPVVVKESSELAVTTGGERIEL